MPSHFYAYLARMKYIERWSLMHSTERENIAEHSHGVAVTAHALALVENEYFGGQLDEHAVLALALYHECSEVITGDLPAPIKYFNSDIKHAYKNLEGYANDKLLSMLPEKLRARYKPLLLPDQDSPEYRIVKAADKLCAYVKCLQELSRGNKEFKKAAAALEREIKKLDLPSVSHYLENFLPSFKLTLDELE